MDADTLNYQKRVIHNYWDDINIIPVFINNTNMEHIKCKEISKELLSKLVILLEPKVLTTRVTNRMFNEFTTYITEMIDIDEYVGILYHDYIFELFTCYKQDCLDGELYESTENISKFLNLFNKKQTI